MLHKESWILNHTHGIGSYSNKGIRCFINSVGSFKNRLLWGFILAYDPLYKLPLLRRTHHAIRSVQRLRSGRTETLRQCVLVSYLRHTFTTRNDGLFTLVSSRRKAIKQKLSTVRKVSTCDFSIGFNQYESDMFLRGCVSLLWRCWLEWLPQIGTP